jgi:tellurite methyltransferase
MQDSNSLVVKSLIEALAPGATVLDLGCGTGRHARALARAGLRVHAIDLDVDALETARSLAEDGEAPAALSYAAGDAGALPFRDAAFDAALCADVLHWCADAAAFDRAWKEAWRVLRPGGVFGARLRLRDFAPGAAPLGAGRYRLETGAEWFLAERADLEARVSRAGEWLQAPVSDGDGTARLILRKISGIS